MRKEICFAFKWGHLDYPCADNCLRLSLTDQWPLNPFCLLPYFLCWWLVWSVRDEESKLRVHEVDPRSEEVKLQKRPQTGISGMSYDVVHSLVWFIFSTANLNMLIFKKVSVKFRPVLIAFLLQLVTFQIVLTAFLFKSGDVFCSRLFLVFWRLWPGYCVVTFLTEQQVLLWAPPPSQSTDWQSGCQ